MSSGSCIASDYALPFSITGFRDNLLMYKLVSAFGGLLGLVYILVCGGSRLICVVSDCGFLIDLSIFLGHTNTYVMTGVN